jgi:diguanylate cyclase (GGDEF)-like protein
MKPIWKDIYPCIRTAVVDLDSIEALLQQIVGAIAAAYQADCLLWAGLQANHLGALRVYATSGMWDWLEQSGNFQLSSQMSLPESTCSANRSQAVRQFSPQALPSWLQQQQQSPHLTQLETGDLVVPISSRSEGTYASSRDGLHRNSPLQFVMQLSRTVTCPLNLPVEEGCPPDWVTANALPATLDDIQTVLLPDRPQKQAPPTQTTAIQSWSQEELEVIEIVCSQLEMAYSALYWRERLEQSRQQAALVGRIARLLNSSLNPDEIVERIAAELGQGLQCDRCILVDLRGSPVNVLATWTHPERDLMAMEPGSVDRTLWQNIVEMFLQGGASFLEVAAEEPEPEPLQEWLRDIGAASVLLIPLFTQSEFFGTVALLSYRQVRTYQIDELQTICQVADQAAIALTNAQHYQSLWYRQEALRLQNNSLQLEVIKDELTHLMNRRSLERQLEQLSARSLWSVQPAFSAIVCDIDYFKLVNDTHGHRVGDEVLQVVAARLQKQLRRENHAYRYGGEEFVVILAETPLLEAMDVAERLRQAIRSTPIVTSTGFVEVTASFGVAQQQSMLDHDAWDVLQRADQALYQAKRRGRDRVEAPKQPC